MTFKKILEQSKLYFRIILAELSQLKRLSTAHCGMGLTPTNS